jgi:hypothetical protein
VASTWAALSQLQPSWLPHVAGRTGSGRIRCGSALRGRPCAKGYEWTGARDQAGSAAASTVCGPAREGKTPPGFGGRPAGVRRKSPKGRRSTKVSPAARVNGCWATRPLARLGCTIRSWQGKMALRPRPALRRHDTASPAAWLGWPAPVGSTHAREAAQVR